MADSIVLERAQEDQATVRLHMWYPGSPINWYHDPLIAQDLQEMQQPGYELVISPAENPRADGSAIMIERRKLPNDP